MDWIAGLSDWVNVGLFGKPTATFDPATPMNADVIDIMAAQFVDQINTLGGVLPAKFHILYFAFAMIAFITALAKMMYLRSVKPVAEFFQFYVFLMVLLVVSTNWNAMADGWVGWMSRTAFQATGQNLSFMSPSLVLVEGFRIIKSLYDSGISFYRIFLGSSEDSIAGLVLLFALGWLAWAVIQMVAVLVVMMVFFKLSSLLALCLLPFLLLGMTRFMAAPGLVRIIQYGLQFFIVGLIIGLTFRFISGWTFSDRPDANEIVSFVIAVGVLAVLLKHGMNVAKEHIAGTPITAGREGASALTDGMNSLTRSVQTLTRTMANNNRQADMSGGGGINPAINRVMRAVGGGSAGGGGKGGSANANRTGGASGGRGGASGGASPGRWAAEPTKKQIAAAGNMGLDLSGMNRAQASAALEKAGLDPTWTKDSASGQAALKTPAWAQRAGSSQQP